MGLTQEHRPLAMGGALDVDRLGGAINPENSQDIDRPQAALVDAWRVVANAKLTAFRQQCWRLALLSQQGALGTQAAVDQLWLVATAHALVRSLGEDRVQAIISEAFLLSFEGDGR